MEKIKEREKKREREAAEGTCMVLHQQCWESAAGACPASIQTAPISVYKQNNRATGSAARNDRNDGSHSVRACVGPHTGTKSCVLTFLPSFSARHLFSGLEDPRTLTLSFD